MFISCILLFIIYSSIVCILVYYFFRHREILNIFTGEIYQDMLGLFGGCPKHNTIGLLIPGFIYSRSSSNKICDETCDETCDDTCNECAKEETIRESSLYNVQILSKIYTLLKIVDAKVLEDIGISSRCKIFQQLLEYIIRNYKELHDGNYTLYERLQTVYLDKDRQIKTPTQTQEDKQIAIENIPVLEEYSSILKKLDTICQGIDIGMTPGTFIIAFYKDLHEFVKDSRKYLAELDM